MNSIHRRLLAPVASLIIMAAPFADASFWPSYNWDPATISTCTTWMDPFFNQSCAEFRSYWGFTPEQFHEFNPSIGVDCSGWDGELMTSYCVADEARDDQLYATAAFTESLLWETMTRIPMAQRTPTATIAGMAIPSPATWFSPGCWKHDPEHMLLLGKQPSLIDDKMTWAKCKARCWELVPQVLITRAGIRNGNECWCGTTEMVYNGQMADFMADSEKCNVPCAGDQAHHCGGKDHVEIAGALVITGSGTPWGGVKATGTTTTSAPTASSTQGASGTPKSAAGGRFSQRNVLLAFAGMVVAMAL